VCKGWGGGGNIPPSEDWWPHTLRVVAWQLTPSVWGTSHTLQSRGVPCTVEYKVQLLQHSETLPLP